MSGNNAAMPLSSVVARYDTNDSVRKKCFACVTSRCVMHTSSETVGSKRRRSVEPSRESASAASSPVAAESLESSETSSAETRRHSPRAPRDRDR